VTEALASGLAVGPRRFRNAAEFDHFVEIRRKGFTSWYVGRPGRWSLDNGWLAMNAKAEVFPEFCLEARAADGRPLGYLAAAPAYWGGSPQSLHDMRYHDAALKLTPPRARVLTALYLATVVVLRSRTLFATATAPLRTRKISRCNSLVFLAMTVDPAAQGRNVPAALIAGARASASRLGFAWILAPFRPNRYGEWKAARRLEHTDALFREYCSATKADGLPLDPWLRSVARNGARFVRVEPRSYSVTGSLAEFEAFRREHRPDDWYEPSRDVWECGETATWYVDRGRGLVVAVEPNYWGVIEVDPPAALTAAAV
jgi:GNAT superfamily N-acetyltransferase